MSEETATRSSSENSAKSGTFLSIAASMGRSKVRCTTFRLFRVAYRPREAFDTKSIGRHKPFVSRSSKLESGSMHLNPMAVRFEGRERDLRREHEHESGDHEERAERQRV